MIPDYLNYLVVEDLVSDSFLLQRQFKKISDHPEIRFVDSLLGLRAALRTYIPDFVITDFNLEGFDAFDVMETIKKYNEHIPVIVITGNLKNHTNKEKLLEMGADGFFYKDPMNELHARLNPLFEELIEKKRGYLIESARRRKKFNSEQEEKDFFREHGEKKPEKASFLNSLRRLFSTGE